MELELIRALFPQNMMGQLYLNNELLCICVTANKEKVWTLISSLPDGRYSLRKPGKGKEDWSLKITNCQCRKPLFIKLGESSIEEPVSYDDEVPLYLSWGNNSHNFFSEMAY